MKKYIVTYKIKYEKIWCKQCLQSLIVEAKTKKEAKEKTFKQINQYTNSIVSIEEIKEHKIIGIEKIECQFNTINKIIWD